ncbi:MAG: OsmC family protein [Thermoleophilaceae bacterium]
MAVAEREASIHWKGDVQKGGGTMAMESSGAFGDFGISLPTRTESPDAHALATLNRTGEGLAVTKIDLTVRGKVAGLDQSSFEDFAQQAEKACPISNALRGNVEINLSATLAE